jgi:hypothetical protein
MLKGRENYGNFITKSTGRKCYSLILVCSHELKVLEAKNNSISVGLSVGLEGRAATHLGSQLFTRGVSGTRVVTHITKVTTILRP